jgi:uncharacterized membrane protein
LRCVRSLAPGLPQSPDQADVSQQVVVRAAAIAPLRPQRAPGVVFAARFRGGGAGRDPRIGRGGEVIGAIRVRAGFDAALAHRRLRAAPNDRAASWDGHKILVRFAMNLP